MVKHLTSGSFFKGAKGIRLTASFKETLLRYFWESEAPNVILIHHSGMFSLAHYEDGLKEMIRLARIVSEDADSWRVERVGKQGKWVFGKDADGQYKREYHQKHPRFQRHRNIGRTVRQKREAKKMNTGVIKEEPAFTLQGSSYNGEGEQVKVSFAELRRAKTGEKWEAHDTHNCGRALYEESAEIVYKTLLGCAVLFCSWGTTDEPNPRPWDGEPALRWFAFA